MANGATSEEMGTVANGATSEEMGTVLKSASMEQSMNTCGPTDTAVH